MPIDASIPLGVRPVQIESPVNQLAKVLQIQGLQQDQQMSRLKMDEYQRGVDRTNRMQEILGGGGGSEELRKGGFLKESMDLDKSGAEVAKQKSDVTKNSADIENKTISMYRDASQAITDPQSAVDFVTHMHTDPRLKDSAIARIPLDQALAQIPKDPAQLAAWKQQFALGATKFMELNKPTTNVVNAGGTSQVLQTPGLGGAPTVAATVQHTVSPDAQLQANTSTANNQRTINAENLRAGVMPGGGMDENSERTAQAIASGQLPAPTGMALLNPKNQRILGRVMEINPQYDATTVDAKRKAARDFTTGQLGNSMRSFQVAGQHLDQLNTLVDALNNGNMQIVNKIGNAYASQTGNPAPTNFDAAKDVVSKEVVKAIVAGGGGVSERQELAHLMDQAKSPAQLKGVIQQYRNLMAAQHDALLQQRDAAGLPRSTLPNYTEASGTAAPGMPAMSAIDAELARRGHK